MSKHTPIPWRVSPHSSKVFCWVERADGGSKKGQPVLGCDLRADAELIVRAVNAHEELLDAARAALALIRSLKERDGFAGAYANEHVLAQAIAKAEGRSNE